MTFKKKLTMVEFALKDTKKRGEKGISYVNYVPLGRRSGTSTGNRKSTNRMASLSRFPIQVGYGLNCL